MKAVQARVSGRVQGVFFRQSSVDKARELGLTGWVRNTVDGDVEALIQGEEQPLQVMLAWLKHGPPAARVDALDLHEATVDNSLHSFDVRY